VTDEANQPLFVFDRDSSLAGALWYLHFSTVGGMSDEKALAEAARLGFRNDQDDNSRTMWIAVQNYLRNQNRERIRLLSRTRPDGVRATRCPRTPFSICLARRSSLQ